LFILITRYPHATGNALVPGFLDPEGNRVSMLQPIPRNWHAPKKKAKKKIAKKKAAAKTKAGKKRKALRRAAGKRA